MKQKQLPLWIVLALFLFNQGINAQITDTIKSLIVSEVFLGIHAGYSFVEFANAGNDTLDLMMFEVGSSSYETATSPYHDPRLHPNGRAYIILGEWLPESKRFLPPGGTVVLVNADPSPAWCGDITGTIYGNLELITQKADLVFWRSADTTCNIPMTMARPVFHWGGLTTQYVEFHSGGDSVVVDAVHNDILANGNLGRERREVAGIAEATASHFLVRKGSVKSGNLDWDNARGTSLEDSEWMPIPQVFGYQGNPWIRMYTTLGHFGPAHVNEQSFSSDVVSVDYNNHILTVPWGIYGDSLINKFNLGGGLAWQYMLSGLREDSLHQLTRTGDTLLMFAAGETLEEVPFRVEVAEPATDMALVFPVNTPGSSTAARWSSPFVVTNNIPGMDSITGNYQTLPGPVRGQIRNPIPYATRVDSLLKYLEKAPKASWEIVWVDGKERADIIMGDILKITAENGTTVKEYFLAVDTIPTRSSNAYLASLTWPDVPASTMEDPAWRHDTIPGFAPDQLEYKLKVPYGINSVPALVAKPQSLNAKLTVQRAKTLNGPIADRTTLITVLAEDDSTVRNYKIIFEKEMLQSNVQPFTPEPFFSQMVFWQFQAHNFFEIAHAGNRPLDLSNYMIARGIGGQTPADVIQSGLSTDAIDFENRYTRYIPGYQYEKLEYWQLEPGNIIKDYTVDPIIQPNDVFLTGRFTMSRITWGPPRYDQCDIKWNNTKTWPDNWSEIERTSTTGTIFSNIPDKNHPILLLKILNDSVKQGLKPIGDPADYEVVDVFGGYSGNVWVANTDTLSQAGRNTSGWGLIRKPTVYQGNPLPEGSFGPTDEQSEWISRPRTSLEAEFGGFQSQVEVSTGVGYHNYDAVTLFMSTVNSYNYLVSEGYKTPQLIRGVVTGTTANDFIGNIIKADPGQEIKLLSSANGSEIASGAELANGDTLMVTSADDQNITKYVINVSAAGLSSNAILTSNDYTIEINGIEGTIKGLQYGTPIEVVLGKVQKPAGAKLSVINDVDNLVPMKVLNHDSIHVATQVSQKIYFEVIAEDMQTKIVYQLVPDATPSDAMLYSTMFAVDQEVNFITDIPDGIRVSAFLSELWTSVGATLKIVDKFGLERTMGAVKFDDQIIVTSEDGTNTNTYYLNFLQEAEGMDAYVLSNAFIVDQNGGVIYGVPETLNLVIFMNSITPAKLASVKVVDMDGNEITTNTVVAAVNKLVVTSGNGENVVEYDLLTSLPYTLTFTVTHGTNPVIGATINVAGKVLTTDASGILNITVPSGDYNYSLTAEGFETQTGTVSISDADKNVDIRIIGVSVKSFITDGISVYPNPNAGELIIDRLEHAGEMQVRIINITGAVVFVNEYPPASQNTIMLNHLKSGMYFLELRIDGKVHYSKLFME